MKKKRFFPDAFAVYGGLILLLLAGIAAFVFRQDFSGWEKRSLTGIPGNLSLSNWTMNDDLESFLSDQVPFRQPMVNLHALTQVYTGRATQLEAWPVGDAVTESPVRADQETLKKRVAGMKELAGDTPCLFLTPPTAGMMRMNEMTAARRALYGEESAIYDELTAEEGFVPLREAFEASSEPTFYYSDHHWNSTGTELAYRAYCRAAGLEPAAQEAFTYTQYGHFHGTTYSRSGLPFVREDTLICAEPKAAVTLTIREDGAEYDHLIFPEKAETYDGYAVYLNGNHGMLTISNPEAAGGTLLVFRDSFASSLLPYLSANYARITAVDVRYYPGSFRDAMEEAGEADQILFLYSLDSLANDTSIARKLRR